jgi:hypothetical protein
MCGGARDAKNTAMDKMNFDTGNVIYLRILVGIGIAGVVIRM